MSQETNILGLKSLFEKVHKIESVLGDDINLAETFVHNVINDIRSQQYNKLSGDIQLFVDGFKKNLPENIDAFNDVVQLCSYGIKYVENFIGSFAKLTNNIVTGDFKLKTCISLVKEVTGNNFTDDFLTKSINHLVPLHYPKSETPKLSKKQSLSKKTGTFLCKFTNTK